VLLFLAWGSKELKKQTQTSFVLACQLQSAFKKHFFDDPLTKKKKGSFRHFENGQSKTA
jgi:hypothetical protein